MGFAGSGEGKPRVADPVGEGAVDDPQAEQVGQFVAVTAGRRHGEERVTFCPPPGLPKIGDVRCPPNAAAFVAYPFEGDNDVEHAGHPGRLVVLTEVWAEVAVTEHTEAVVERHHHRVAPA